MEEEHKWGPVSLEVLSVGPLFREPDHRWLEIYVKKPPFFKHVPIGHALLS